jgi:endonuclease YncB( thermonuclease family)
MPCLVAGCVLFGLAAVTDGDTIRIGADRIRLHAINAPERNEPGGRAATNALRSIIAGRPVRCVWNGDKTHRRYVAVCTVGDVDLGRELVRRGYAAACPRYSRRYMTVERRAKARRLGIWRNGYRKPRWCMRRT